MIKLSNNNGLVYYGEIPNINEIGYQGGTADLIINHNSGKLITRCEALASSGSTWMSISDRGNYYGGGNYKFGLRLINTNLNTCTIRRGSVNASGGPDNPYTMKLWLFSSD